MSGVIPNGWTALRTRPLEALIIGGWVGGLSDRDIESLVSEAGLGQISKSTVSQITKEPPLDDSNRPDQPSFDEIGPRTGD